ncbi:hypothetical protein HanXRQr2_Chr10g0458541 [Helianthus annuus]|uniref:Uncharacterized protein n=1 Tax=Helianthus annuus TaxID=4232 RepID=A0A251TPW0_HELAN|nr:hypothetical protein HanXRQr2_Chr10g0458541 [Helianthus annuus]
MFRSLSLQIDYQALGQNFISSFIHESASRSPHELSYHRCSYFSPTQVCFRSIKL